MIFNAFNGYSECREHFINLIKSNLNIIGVPEKNLFIDTMPTVPNSLGLYDRFIEGTVQYASMEYYTVELSVLIVEDYSKNENVKSKALKKVEAIIKLVNNSNLYNDGASFGEYQAYDLTQDKPLNRYQILVTFTAYFRL